MKRTSPKTHALTIALLASFGLADTVVAQEAARPEAEPAAVESRNAAVAAAEKARTKAEIAEEAATAADKLEDTPAPTARAAAAADYRAEVAADAAINAKQAADAATEFAQKARSARTGAEVGMVPISSALIADRAEGNAQAAAANAIDAAHTAKVATLATAAAVTPPATGVRIYFSNSDLDGDGIILRNEAKDDPNLMHEFDTIDRNKDGRLSTLEILDSIQP